jgi:hypothetical protein
MSEEPGPAAVIPDQPRSISDISRLAGQLAERVVQAQLFGKRAPEADIRLLMDAAMLLEQYGEELPLLLVPIVQEVRAGMAAPADAEPESDA